MTTRNREGTAIAFLPHNPARSVVPIMEIRNDGTVYEPAVLGYVFALYSGSVRVASVPTDEKGRPKSGETIQELYERYRPKFGRVFGRREIILENGERIAW